MNEAEKVHHLNKQAWNKVVDDFAKYRDEVKITKLFQTFMGKIGAGGTILDLGCGTGLPFTYHMAEQGFQVIGIVAEPSKLHAII